MTWLEFTRAAAGALAGQFFKFLFVGYGVALGLGFGFVTITTLFG